MAHLSDTNIKLQRIDAGSSLDQSFAENDVWFIKLPFYETEESIPDKKGIIDDLNNFITNSNQNATIAFISSPVFAGHFLSELSPLGHLKLWIGVKLKYPIKQETGLIQHHAALVVITRYSKTLQHTKTKIGYTFCPVCEKTTKDYGGKKHLYSDYGTLMSDVWRDIEIDFNNNIEPVIKRLQDLFGIKPYKSLKCIDLTTRYAPIKEIIIYQENNINTINTFKYNASSESRIIHGDCLEVLREIPSNSVDFCFADPPYNVNKKYESWDDAIDIREYFNWCDKWIYELARIIKPGRTVAILNIPQWAARHFKYMKEVLTFQDWILWEGLSLPVRMIMPAHYSVICFSKGIPQQLPGLKNKTHSELESQSLESLKEFFCNRSNCITQRKNKGIPDKTPITNLWWDIHRLKHNSKRVDHPTQLPPAFMHRLISLFTKEGELVLDPFNGSGTTTLCAAQLKRQYFGIELSEKYYNLSIERQTELASGIDPFRKQDITPIAKNSYVKRLQKQKYAVDKKTLQLEVKQISIKLQRIPNREDVITHSIYPIEYYDNYFINWAEVTAAARTTGMENVENRKDYVDKEQLRLFEAKKGIYNKENQAHLQAPKG